MAFYRIPLKAGVAHIQEIAGVLILIDGIDGAAGVDLTPIINGSRYATLPSRKPGFKYRTNYDAVELVAAADCEVRLFLTTNEVSLGFTDGAQVNVLGAVQVTNQAGQRIPVDIAGTNVSLSASNVGINNTDALAVPVRTQALGTIVNIAPVTVGTAAAALVSDATLRKLRIRNSHATATIAIGGPGVTLANGAIQLLPGDVWTEDDAAGAAWFCISDTASTIVQMQGLK